MTSLGCWAISSLALSGILPGGRLLSRSILIRASRIFVPRCDGVPCRVVVATHPVGKKKSPVGLTRSGVVYELFFTRLPQQAFTASDVVELYLHRGAFDLGGWWSGPWFGRECVDG